MGQKHRLENVEGFLEMAARPVDSGEGQLIQVVVLQPLVVLHELLLGP